MPRKSSIMQHISHYKAYYTKLSLSALIIAILSLLTLNIFTSEAGANWKKNRENNCSSKGWNNKHNGDCNGNMSSLNKAVSRGRISVLNRDNPKIRQYKVSYSVCDHAVSMSGNSSCNKFKTSEQKIFHENEIATGYSELKVSKIKSKYSAGLIDSSHFLFNMLRTGDKNNIQCPKDALKCVCAVFERKNSMALGGCVGVIPTPPPAAYNFAVSVPAIPPRQDYSIQKCKNMPCIKRWYRDMYSLFEAPRGTYTVSDNQDETPALDASNITINLDKDPKEYKPQIFKINKIDYEVALRNNGAELCIQKTESPLEEICTPRPGLMDFSRFLILTEYTRTHLSPQQIPHQGISAFIVRNLSTAAKNSTEPVGFDPSASTDHFQTYYDAPPANYYQKMFNDGAIFFENDNMYGLRLFTLYKGKKQPLGCSLYDQKTLIRFNNGIANNHVPPSCQFGSIEFKKGEGEKVTDVDIARQVVDTYCNGARYDKNICHHAKENLEAKLMIEKAHEALSQTIFGGSAKKEPKYDIFVSNPIQVEPAVYIDDNDKKSPRPLVECHAKSATSGYTKESYNITKLSPKCSSNKNSLYCPPVQLAAVTTAANISCASTDHIMNKNIPEKCDIAHEDSQNNSNMYEGSLAYTQSDNMLNRTGKIKQIRSSENIPCPGIHNIKSIESNYYNRMCLMSPFSNEWDFVSGYNNPLLPQDFTKSQNAQHSCAKIPNTCTKLSKQNIVSIYGVDHNNFYDPKTGAKITNKQQFALGDKVLLKCKPGTKPKKEFRVCINKPSSNNAKNKSTSKKSNNTTPPLLPIFGLSDPSAQTESKSPNKEEECQVAFVEARCSGDLFTGEQHPCE